MEEWVMAGKRGWPGEEGGVLRNSGSTAGATEGRNRFLQHWCICLRYPGSPDAECRSSVCTPLMIEKAGLRKWMLRELQTVTVRLIAKSSTAKDPFGLSPSGRGGTGHLRRKPTSKFPLDLQPRQLPQSSSIINTNNLQIPPANTHSHSYLRKPPTYSKLFVRAISTTRL